MTYNFIGELIEKYKDTCINFVSAVPGTAAGCTVPVAVARSGIELFIQGFEILLDLSEKIYSDYCTVFDDVCK